MFTNPGQYRKWWMAVAGVLAQLLVALANAADAGMVPDSWLPWVAVAVAIGTAIGVYRRPNDPKHRALSPDLSLNRDDWQTRGSRRDDRGDAWVPLLLFGVVASASAAAGILLVWLLQATPGAAEVCLP